MKLLAPLVSIFVLIFANSALADGFKYQSETCDFTLELPEGVEVTRQCSPLEEGEDETCVEQLRYTKTVQGNASIHIDLSCNSIGQIPYDNYNKEKMLFTAESYLLSQGNTLDDYELRYIGHENSKRVLVFGSGKSGLSDMIYFGHVWLGRNSLMSMNARIIGAGNELADNVFKSILVSLANKVDDQPLEAEATE